MNIRRWDPTEPTQAITELLHRAYRSLGDRGWNYTAVNQSDAVTRERMDGAVTLLAYDGDALVGVMTAHEDDGTRLYRQPGVYVLGPIAVEPDLQGRGLGKDLLDRMEVEVAALGITTLALDTAEPAEHLIETYSRWGFRRVGFVNWGSKSYESVLMAKCVSPNRVLIHPARAEDAHGAAEVVRVVYEEYDFTWEPGGYHLDLFEIPESYPDGFWVARVGDDLLGCIGLTVHAKVPGTPGQVQDRRVCGTDCELNRLYVHPEGRRLGIGSRLTEVVLNEARRRGCSAMELWSDKRFVDAHRLYQRYGAQVVGERICDDPDEAPEWGLYLPL